MLLFSVLLITLLCLGIDELIVCEKNHEGAYRQRERSFLFFFNAINKRIKWKMQRMKDKIASLRK